MPRQNPVRPDTGTTVKEMFAQMPASVNAAAAKGMNSVIQFNLTGDGGGTYHWRT